MPTAQGNGFPLLARTVKNRTHHTRFWRPRRRLGTFARIHGRLSRLDCHTLMWLWCPASIPDQIARGTHPHAQFSAGIVFFMWGEPKPPTVSGRYPDCGPAKPLVSVERKSFTQKSSAFPHPPFRVPHHVLSGSRSPVASWSTRRAPERLALVAVSEVSGWTIAFPAADFYSRERPGIFSGAARSCTEPVRSLDAPCGPRRGRFKEVCRKRKEGRKWWEVHFYPLMVTCNLRWKSPFGNNSRIFLNYFLPNR